MRRRRTVCRTRCVQCSVNVQCVATTYPHSHGAARESTRKRVGGRPATTLSQATCSASLQRAVQRAVQANARCAMCHVTRRAMCHATRRATRRVVPIMHPQMGIVQRATRRVTRICNAQRNAPRNALCVQRAVCAIRRVQRAILCLLWPLCRSGRTGCGLLLAASFKSRGTFEEELARRHFERHFARHFDCQYTRVGIHTCPYTARCEARFQARCEGLGGWVYSLEEYQFRPTCSPWTRTSRTGTRRTGTRRTAPARPARSRSRPRASSRRGRPCFC